LKTAIYRAGFASWLVPCCGGETASLAYALTYVTFWGLILTMMYHRRIFIGI
jgi:predicted acyltransferase